MKIPPRIRITPKATYEIVWIDGFVKKDQVGECRYEEKQIVIKKGISEKEQIDTLIHEFLHAWEFEYKIKISHKAVYQLETAITNFFKINGFYK